jgi:DNA-directed RNA polymerase subunit E'/Rpb7
VIVKFFMANAATTAETGKMEAVTGKVTAVDPQGMAITISAKAGKEIMDVGAIVNKDTRVKAKGKATTLKDIRVGDTVTVRYLRSDDLYAKEIAKK